MKITAKHIQQIEDFLNESEEQHYRQISHIVGEVSMYSVRYLVRTRHHNETLEAIFYVNEDKGQFNWIAA